jgi:AraC family transcriptional regulator of adaptative response / DNA-3-methyladenine glycosylase II
MAGVIDDFELRRPRRAGGAPAPGTIELRLSACRPFDGAALLRFLADRAVPGVESVDAGTYRRSLSLDHGGGVVALTPEDGAVRCALRLDDPRDLTAAVARCKRVLDLHADPLPISARLGQDPVLGELVRRRPGLRVPGCVDGFELAARAIVGQQISVAAAGTLLGRLAASHGEPLAEPDGAVTHRFPAAEAVAALEPAELPMPRGRGEALRALGRLVADEGVAFDAGADAAGALSALRAIHGVGPWTASYVAMRALGDPDAFLPGDVGVRHALERLGEDADPRAALRLAEPWRPWRSYAVLHLWSSLSPDARTTVSGRAPSNRPRAGRDRPGGLLRRRPRERGRGRPGEHGA